MVAQATSQQSQSPHASEQPQYPLVKILTLAHRRISSPRTFQIEHLLLKKRGASLAFEVHRNPLLLYASYAVVSKENFFLKDEQIKFEQTFDCSSGDLKMALTIPSSSGFKLP
jgi:hypothetical protein